MKIFCYSGTDLQPSKRNIEIPTQGLISKNFCRLIHGSGICLTSETKWSNDHATKEVETKVGYDTV